MFIADLPPFHFLPRRRGILKALVMLWLCLSFTTADAQKRMMVMEIKSEIDSRMTRYVDLAVKNAEAMKADIVLIEMDTYGGVLTDAKDIVDKLMAVKMPVWVLINSDAASAGALISIACDSIYMVPGASIGAATVVDGDGARAPDKYQSYMRSIMRSTAEVNGRNPTIAEAMVDEAVVIDSIKKEGQVVTFSTSEALRYGYCEAQVGSINELLKLTGTANYELTYFHLSKADEIIAFFLNPFISGILILIIFGGIYFEMQTPGLGFAGLAALVALVFYLVPYYLNGLAENWEVIMLVAGIVLIALEIFVIPGFGVAGIAGIAATLLALVLIMVNNDAFDFEFVHMRDIISATAAAMAGVVGSAVLLLVGGSQLHNTRFYGRVALTHTQESKDGYHVNFNREIMIGRQGMAHTVLRPSGKVSIDGKVFDAFTRGEFVEAGEPIEVILESGSSLQVRRVNRDVTGDTVLTQ